MKNALSTVDANVDKKATKKREPVSKRALSSLRTGARIHRLVYGKMPKELARVERASFKYRRWLEAEIESMRGSVTAYDAHLIDEAMCAQSVAGVARWLMLHRFQKMSSQELLTCKQTESKAVRQRNAAIERLGLDPRAVTDDEAIAGLYNATWVPAAECSATTPPDVSAGTSVAHTADGDSGADCGDATASGADGDTLPDLF